MMIKTTTIVGLTAITVTCFVLGALAAASGCGSLLGFASGQSPPAADQRPPAGPPAQTSLEKAADAVDTVGPPILEMIAAAGIPGVGLVAALWRKHVAARRTANLVASVQAGRERLSAHTTSGREIFDQVLTAVQTDATSAMVRRIKKSTIRPSTRLGASSPPLDKARGKQSAIT